MLVEQCKLSSDLKAICFPLDFTEPVIVIMWSKHINLKQWQIWRAFPFLTIKKFKAIHFSS